MGMGVIHEIALLPPYSLLAYDYSIMAFNFSGQHPVAVITGAARRVGRAVAVELAAHGYDLVLTYNRSRQEIEATTEACRITAANAASRLYSSAGVCGENCDDDSEFASDDLPPHEIEIALHQVDLAEEESIIEFTEWLDHHIPRLDALIHNAGRYRRTPWGEVSSGEALEHYQVNALAPLLLTQAVDHLLRQSGGCVILFSDIHVLGRPRKKFCAYSMSKAAATELVRVLAREMAPEVRVLGIAPGVVAWPDDTPDEEVESYESRIPLERSGKPADAARLVRFLISKNAGYITGEIIRLDGGRALA